MIVGNIILLFNNIILVKMTAFLLHVLICLYLSNEVVSFNMEKECNGEDTEVVLAFVVHRHGDRTPELTLLSFSDDKDRDMKLIHPYGYGSLTNKGKNRSYEIGKYLRKRYNSLLSEDYFEDEVYLRSTDKDRTKMTMLTALAAMYPPSSMMRWKSDLNWQPIPYTTYPVHDDYMMTINRCKAVSFETIFLSKAPVMEKYGRLLNLLTNHTKYDFNKNPLLVYFYYDLFASQKAINVDPPVWLVPHVSELEEAGTTAINFMYRKNITKRLLGGVFINEFVESSKRIISGEEVTKRVRIYSAHDINVAAEMAASNVKFGLTKYGSVFSLELHRVKGTQKYLVVPVYLPQAGDSTASVLQVKDVKDCSFEAFSEITSPFRLSEQQLKKECVMEPQNFDFNSLKLSN